MNKLLLCLSIFAVFGCTHSVHLVHVGDFRPYQKITSGKIIQAKAEQTVFMGLTQETDYVNSAQQNLIAQCPNGIIQGPMTRLSTSHGFFSWTNRVFIQGLCLAKVP